MAITQYSRIARVTGKILNVHGSQHFLNIRTNYIQAASLVAELVKNSPAMREILVLSLGLEDFLEKGKATHSSILPGEFHSPGVTKSQTGLNCFHFHFHISGKRTRGYLMLWDMRTFTSVQIKWIWISWFKKYIIYFRGK